MPDENTTATQDNTVVAESETTTTTTTDTTTQSTASTEATKDTAVTTDTKTETATNEKPTGAPESYADFKLGEGYNFQDEALTEFKTYAKGQNWTQEQAQGAIDFYTQKIAPEMQKTQLDAWNKQIEGWTKESEKTHGKEGIEAANKALGRFSTPEFTKFLADTGLGNHPEMIKAFRNIGAKISESGIVEGGNKGKADKEPWNKAYQDMD